MDACLILRGKQAATQEKVNQDKINIELKIVRRADALINLCQGGEVEAFNLTIIGGGDECVR